MRIAVLVKQIPKFEEMELGADGRLRRDGIELEMNAYCRRAVSQAVALASERVGSTITVVTLGPPSAEDTLREALAWGLERDVDIHALHVSDPAFAGSDTLATAKALAATLRREGPFDLILTGRNSLDADTGQVGPELAELLDLPFLTGARYLSLDGDRLDIRCEHDDGWLQAEVRLPAIVSCAERLIDPSKVDPDGRAAVPADRVRTVTAADLGAGPWGQAASPTWVGPVKVMAVSRARMRWMDAPVAEQITNAVHMLRERGALDGAMAEAMHGVPAPRPLQPRVVVLVEPHRTHMTRELLGAAAQLTGNVLAITVVASDSPDATQMVAWGADDVVQLTGANIEEDVARAVTDLARAEQPWAILSPSTAWGREIASRVVAALDAGLTGDAVELDVDGARLVAWKPAFGGQLVAAYGCTSTPQLATVRVACSPTSPREMPMSVAVTTRAMGSRDRVRILARTREDDIDVLVDASAVIGIGTGVAPGEYEALEPLRATLMAELGATRKVTDKGWLPRARQIGITGRSIAPRLFVSIGASGKFNHMVGVRAAGTVLAINPDPDAPLWDASDVGIVGDWREIVPQLDAALRD